MADVLKLLRERIARYEERVHRITGGAVPEAIAYLHADRKLDGEAAAEIERLREQNQAAFDLGFKAAGGEITPIADLQFSL